MFFCETLMREVSSLLLIFFVWYKINNAIFRSTVMMLTLLYDFSWKNLNSRFFERCVFDHLIVIVIQCHDVFMIIQSILWFYQSIFDDVFKSLNRLLWSFSLVDWYHQKISLSLEQKNVVFLNVVFDQNVFLIFWFSISDSDVFHRR